MRSFGAILFLLVTCFGALSCDSNRGRSAACSMACKKCDPDKGCQDCTPTKNFCDGDTVVACNADGTVGESLKMCDSTRNAPCKEGACVSPCDAAAATRSY